MRRRAVITGLGMVTPIGIGKEAFWEGVRAGKSAVRRATRFDPSIFRSHCAAEVDGFNAEDYLDPKKAKRLDRFAQFAVVSAILAAADAGLDVSREDPNRVGVSIGSALGGTAFAEEQYGVFRGQGLRSVDPSLAVAVFCGSASCNIGITLGITGPNVANSNSCSSGTIALGEALRFVRSGEADVVFAGGAEAPLAALCYGAFAIIKAMSARNDEPEKACRPFDLRRDGFVMGEGAAVLVIEELQRALKRGARIYAELLGYGLTNDAYHMTAPLPDGTQAANAMTRALDDARVDPAGVDYINAHGSSTLLNDRTETAAVKRVFGERAYRIPISGTKPLHAHSLGAAGAIEAAICALAMENSYVPPTINLDEPDPECDLDYVPWNPREQKIDCLLSNSFGFGGINAALVMGKRER
ncbi:MAG: beta-ketoacyl-ACP synthase II [Armatimonadota bacterium]|nr:beta-ketoacyl-ACP synthase II [Armatimonadota bacterium]